MSGRQAARRVDVSWTRHPQAVSISVSFAFVRRRSPIIASIFQRRSRTVAIEYERITVVLKIGRSALPPPSSDHRALVALLTRSGIIGQLVPVDVVRCLAKLDDVVSVGVQMGGESRIV